jgi:cyclic dehypoxanthinyl futalosine synthase
MGSIMIEENVVSAAGAHNRASEETLRYLIKEAGFIPQQRDILYRCVNREPPSKPDDLKRTSLPEMNLLVTS